MQKSGKIRKRDKNNKSQMKLSANNNFNRCRPRTGRASGRTELQQQQQECMFVHLAFDVLEHLLLCLSLSLVILSCAVFRSTFVVFCLSSFLVLTDSCQSFSRRNTLKRRLSSIFHRCLPTFAVFWVTERTLYDLLLLLLLCSV